MFCKYCGSQIPDDSKVCPDCGKELIETAKAPEAQAAVGEVITPGAQAARSESGKPFAIASLVLGIAAIILCFANGLIGLVAGIVGLVMASMAKKNGYTDGMRTAGFVMSLIAVIICAVATIALIACVGAISGALAGSGIHSIDINELQNQLQVLIIR